MKVTAEHSHRENGADWLRALAALGLLALLAAWDGTEYETSEPRAVSVAPTQASGS